MSNLSRRDILQASGVTLAAPSLMMLFGCTKSKKNALENETPTTKGDGESDKNESKEEPAEAKAMKVEYLEIVTPEADALVEQYSKAHGVEFSEPIAGFGNARTAKFEGGGMLGIRGPMRDNEIPVVRPYLLTEDIQASVDAAVAAGADLAMPPMHIPDYGKFAIVVQGGIDCGFWQN